MIWLMKFINLYHPIGISIKRIQALNKITNCQQATIVYCLLPIVY
jgi:hypothetical protein